jgi:hypothetical protein
MQLYYSNVDRRIHLKGADEGWLKADYDFDGKPDFEIRYEDTDRDGFIDTWKTDIDGDGVIDRTVHLRGRNEPVPLLYKRLNARYMTLLRDARAQNLIAIDAMKSTLRQRDPKFQDYTIEQYFRDRLPAYRAAEGVGRRIHDSPEGERFYQDLIRERYFARVRKLLSGDRLDKIEQFYNAGDYKRFAELLRAQ